MLKQTLDEAGMGVKTDYSKAGMGVKINYRPGRDGC